VRRISTLVGLVTAASFALSTPDPVQADTVLAVYLSKPASQTTLFNNTSTETFESLPTGNRTTNFSSAIGTYQLSVTNPFNIQADNLFGAGTGQYMAFGDQTGTSTPITLLFNTPQQYFGFSWSAGDAFNGLTFFNGSTRIGRFSMATSISELAVPTVTALDHTVYNASQYFGQPSTGLNGGQPYAFVNFIASGGSFDKIIFDNSGQTDTGFESDNHTIRASAPAPDASFVFVTRVGASEPISGRLVLLGLLPLTLRIVLRIVRCRRVPMSAA